MRIPRVYQQAKLASGETYGLSKEAAHHLVNVLRMKVGQSVRLFNGEGGSYLARITGLGKNGVNVNIGNFLDDGVESSLAITLVQGISRGKQMDLTLQKAVELGVNRIVPVQTEYSQSKMDAERQLRREEHWQGVIISACEQCGRNTLPVIERVQLLQEWLAGKTDTLSLILHPRAEITLAEIRDRPEHVILLAGPEGGFSDQEFDLALDAGYRGIKLGPRILRTETAALVALAACQTLWGDIQ